MRTSLWKTLFATVVLCACASDGITGTNTPTLASISVSLSASSLVAGQSGQASAILRDDAGNSFVVQGDTVRWTSSNPSVATVSTTTGVISAVGAGTTTISASLQGKTGTAVLTVTAAVPPPAAVARVSLALSSSAVILQQTSLATATLTDAAGNVLTGRTIAFSSSNQAVATVSASGVVTGVAVGSATISAVSEGVSGTATITVNPVPPPAVATVAVTISQLGLRVGEQTQATVVLKDANNNVLTGRTITWSSSNQDVATVSQTGVVTGMGIGTANITATSEGKSGFAIATVPAPSVAGIGITMPAIVSIGASVTATAQLLDANGAVVAGPAISWSSSNSAVATVNQSGVVTGVSGGTATISATSQGSTATASITVVAAVGAATQLAIRTQPAGAVSTVALTTQPVIEIRDVSNALVGGSSLAVTASIASGAGTLVGTTTVNAVNGVATFTNLGINGIGAFTLRFTSSSLAPATSATVTAAPLATQLAIATAPVSTVSTVPFSTQPVIQVRDVGGNLVAGSTAPVTVSIASGTGTLSGTTTVNAVGGVATFTNLIINGIGTYTLSFTSPGLSTATSASITTVAPSATNLVVTTQPAGAASTLAFTTQPVVQVRDVNGNLVSGSSAAVTASVASGSGTLSGTTTVTAVNGVATFTNLVITGTGAHTLIFSSGALTPGSSGSFTVGPPPPTQLSVTTQPSASAGSGLLLAQQPTVQLRDQFGGAALVANVPVTVAIATGSGGTVNGTATVNTDANGVATFTNLGLTGSGNYTLRFSSGTLTAATSSTVSVAAFHLSLNQQPSASARAGIAIPTQPVVQLRDAGNGAVTQAGVQITVSIGSGGGAVGGTVTLTTGAGGNVTFSGISIDGLAGAHTLTFSAPSVQPITSNTVTVTGGAPTQLAIVTQPTSTASDAPTSPQPAVQLRDVFGNDAPGTAVITASLSSGAGILFGLPTATTNASGRATFLNLGVLGGSGSSATFQMSAAGLASASTTPFALTTPPLSDEPVFP